MLETFHRVARKTATHDPRAVDELLQQRDRLVDAASAAQVELPFIHAMKRFEFVYARTRGSEARRTEHVEAIGTECADTRISERCRPQAPVTFELRAICRGSDARSRSCTSEPYGTFRTPGLEAMIGILTKFRLLLSVSLPSNGLRAITNV